MIIGGFRSSERKIDECDYTLYCVGDCICDAATVSVAEGGDDLVGVCDEILVQKRK